MIIADIQLQVAEHFRLTVEQLLAHTKDRSILYPRRIAYYLSRRLIQGPPSYKDIAREFGRGDHVTVLNACRAIAVAQPLNEQLRRDLDAIRARLEQLPTAAVVLASTERVLPPPAPPAQRPAPAALLPAPSPERRSRLVQIRRAARRRPTVGARR